MHSWWHFPASSSSSRIMLVKYCKGGFRSLNKSNLCTSCLWLLSTNSTLFLLYVLYDHLSYMYLMPLEWKLEGQNLELDILCMWWNDNQTLKTYMHSYVVYLVILSVLSLWKITLGEDLHGFSRFCATFKCGQMMTSQCWFKCSIWAARSHRSITAAL